MADKSGVILCVDDDQDILDFFELVLAGKGYEVVLAPTAEEGLRAFKRCQPSLVFVDLMMEEVDAGTNFAKEIKALGSDVP
ncbi:MAG: response regulator, partial [Lentisphaerae bacterium]|nr:response regulator [Lentisphaerota bacterium]